MYFLFILFLIGCFQNKNYPNLYSKYSGYVSCDNESNIIGSGGYIRYKSKNYFITAKHVLRESECSIYFYCDYHDKCNVINSYQYIQGNELIHDLALIPSKKRGAKIKTYNPEYFDEVHFSGHPWGEKEPWASEGSIAYIDSSYFAMNSFAAPGSSGSVVFHKKNPVGIVIAIINTPYGLNTNRVLVIYFTKEVMDSFLE